MFKATRQAHWLSPKRLAILGLMFLIALLPRLYSAQTVGWNWLSPGSFTPINFDEANSCRAWLGAADYSPLLGAQTVTIAGLAGHPAPALAKGNYSVAKAYCISPGHMLVARSYSALLGAMTVVVLGLIALKLAPDKPHIAWTASALLALSGFHATQSHMATVDVAMSFYVYAFLLVMILATSSQKRAPLILSVIFL